MGSKDSIDTDWVVVGSGFGGSVSALRLNEKGYDVTVLESGRRFEDDELPTSTWDVRRYFFAPRVGCRGIFRLSLFKDVTVVSGAGVGGGSLGYANTLYRPLPAFYKDAQWAGLDQDWEATLRPHYDEAERMLGVVSVPTSDAADDLLKAFGESIGVGDTYAKTRVGVYYGTPGETVPDPYFGGEGPDRTGCINCARCMVGCPHNAKNTLVKNYLYLAEKRGVKVQPDTEVVDIRPIGHADGRDGYLVTTERTGAWVRKRRRTIRTRGVVIAAGALGTNKLLQRCRAQGSLALSPRLGEGVRTNSEAVLAVTLPDELPTMNDRVSITGSIYPDEHTHIETCTYGHEGDAISRLYTLMVGDGSKVTRPLKLVGQMLRHPLKLLRLMDPRGWSSRTMILLVMQSLDNAMALRPKPGRGGRMGLQTAQDPARPNPTFLPIANRAAAWIAERTGGIAQSSVMEALVNTPTTAHILGGACIGASWSEGVVDREQRLWGYERLMVVDGSVMPANVGVNPSLTITALAEHAMSHLPVKGLETLGSAGSVQPRALELA